MKKFSFFLIFNIMILLDIIFCSSKQLEKNTTIDNAYIACGLLVFGFTCVAGYFILKNFKKDPTETNIDVSNNITSAKVDTKDSVEIKAMEVPKDPIKASKECLPIEEIEAIEVDVEPNSLPTFGGDGEMGAIPNNKYYNFFEYLSPSNSNYKQVFSNDGTFFIQINEKIKTSCLGIQALTPEDLTNVNHCLSHIKEDTVAKDHFVQTVFNLSDPVIVKFWSEAMEKVFF